MALRIPLNKFKRITQTFLSTPESLYVTPPDRAGVIISALANSISSRAKTLTLSISTQTPSTNFTILSAYPIKKFEVLDLAFEKLIITSEDHLIIASNSLDASTFATNPNAFWEIEEPGDNTTLQNILFTAVSPTLVTLVYNIDIQESIEVETPIFTIEGTSGQTNITISILEIINS